MAKRVTLQDVAAAAGVSPQTVSRVVNSRPDVAEDTRKRVWQTIHRLGYRPNTLARSNQSSIPPPPVSRSSPPAQFFVP